LRSAWLGVNVIESGGLYDISVCPRRARLWQDQRLQRQA